MRLEDCVMKWNFWLYCSCGTTSQSQKECTPQLQFRSESLTPRFS